MYEFWVNIICLLPQKQVFNKLIRRYKYLEKGFEEEIKKVSVFQAGSLTELVFNALVLFWAHNLSCWSDLSEVSF